ncbi:MAG: hypothetical protein Q9227_003064 [Pyrenula ochraceoflavens]
MTSKPASKLVGPDPSKVMSIRDLTPNLTTLSTPFLRFGRIKIGGRSTIVKLQTGSLAVFSPVALTDEVRAKLTSLGGPVKYISALDYEHHIFMTPWSEAFPDAKIIGVEGLYEKRQKDPATKDLKFHHTFTQQSPQLSISEEFDREFAVEYVHSHVNRELVFFHKPSRTMIEADLIFNLPATEQFSKSGLSPTSGLLTRLFIALNNTRGDAIWHKRFLWYAAAGKDRPAFARSVREMEGWDFDRIIPCHGEVVESGGKGVFRKMTEWYREVEDQKRK